MHQWSPYSQYQHGYQQGPPPPAGLAGTPVWFDARPFQQVQENVWVDAAGDAIVLDYYDIAPNLPAALQDLAGLRARTSANTAQAGMGLVDLDVIGLDGMPVIRQMVKGDNPHQERGLAYLGTYTIPRSNSSVVVKVQCLEGQPTGMREASVLPQFLQQYRGGAAAPDEAMAAWAQHPYAYGITGGRPRNHADDPAWDPHFPDHPLSRARRLLGSLAYSIRVDASFKAQPAFWPQY
ncbi:hypothetical protein Q8791_17835 [Nocardiopsis sp. CT-R113]|uniref:Uncharacterized protein n=1 Tax=Nocardiopsis codii TaxID=3065942 RepID=A0ABU7KA45_9ACTN|nr:hypothetical protein [Nocardiopsis sp. CT-R113]MEE2039077.1 hypothetical protein [Nocardiopsis sp. CT-R113]